jgi:hypothetical protein
VGDVNEQRTQSELQSGGAERLLADLNARPPRFVADMARSTHGTAAFYQLEVFPQFASWLREEYRLAASFPDGDIYERRRP